MSQTAPVSASILPIWGAAHAQPKSAMDRPSKAILSILLLRLKTSKIYVELDLFFHRHLVAFIHGEVQADVADHFPDFLVNVALAFFGD